MARLAAPAVEAGLELAQARVLVVLAAVAAAAAAPVEVEAAGEASVARQSQWTLQRRCSRRVEKRRMMAPPLTASAAW